MENNIRINPLKYDNIKCSCGCEIWQQGRIIKRIPGIEIGTGTEDQILDLPVFYCAKCGRILPDDAKIYKMEDPSEENKKSSLII
ncbi:MAG: hypothetical protein [Wendovervirus sonii]|uniref:YgiT-type zinc finger protein n=1 Tax=phage Lak_Megaphage_Sonny TaxID=3109229 RepID=A0ABZ0Z307_9CAUD|nr:MAG: hypothetical protein [phage Lak_Megaphage_Sonny]